MNEERLAEQLEQQIRQWSNHLLRESPLLALAQRGALSQVGMAKYLASLRHLFACSERNLRRAALRARELGLEPLAEHLAQKAGEEHGHADWASADLSQLPEAVRGSDTPARELLNLVQLQGNLIDQHPLCFLAYALWAEYFTVLVGETWLAALSRSGFPREQVSAIAKHIEADREHAATGLRVIDTFWTGDPPLGEILAGVERACHTFERFCLEICTLGSHAA